MSEHDLQSAILSIAAVMPGVELWRNNSGVMGPRRVRFGLHNSKRRTGSPDLVGCAHGRFVGLEVKRPGEALTRAQEAFLGDIRAAGGIGERVDSVQGAVEALERAKESSA